MPTAAGMARDFASRRCSVVKEWAVAAEIERIPKIWSEATRGIPIQQQVSEKILHLFQSESSLVSARNALLRSLRTLLRVGCSVGSRIVTVPRVERRGASRATRSCKSVSAKSTQADVYGTTSARQARSVSRIESMAGFCVRASVALRSASASERAVSAAARWLEI